MPWGWGSNYYGQLGDGTTTYGSIPTQESSMSTEWSKVTTGRDHTVAIKADGTREEGLWASWRWNNV